MTDLIALLHARGGAAHSSDLRAAGVSTRLIRAAVDAGTVIRVRRSWLLLPGVAPELRMAASVGGRLTCVSAAVSHGLWVPRGNGDVHVAVPSTASRLPVTGMRLHWSMGPAPVRRSTVEDAPLNVLFHTAHCLDPADALAVWESALRTSLIDVDVLRRVAWRSSRAAKLAAFASDLSDSGLESRFRRLMVGIGVTVVQQIRLLGHSVDGLIGTSLVTQLDGFEHHSTARDRRRDIRHDAMLALRGFTVLRFDFRQLFFEPVYVQETVQSAMAQGLHLVRPVSRSGHDARTG